MGLKGFGTGSDRKREREPPQVDLGLEIVFGTAGLALQARGFGGCGVPECRYGLWDDALPFLQLGDVRFRIYTRGLCCVGMWDL
jgi:hypothetical protein